MENEFLLGLYVSAVGLGVTFLALGSLILLIRVLVALFPPQKPSATPGDLEERRLEEEAAALAVSIRLMEAGTHDRKDRDESLGKLLEPD